MPLRFRGWESTSRTSSPAILIPIAELSWNDTWPDYDMLTVSQINHIDVELEWQSTKMSVTINSCLEARLMPLWPCWKTLERMRRSHRFRFTRRGFPVNLTDSCLKFYSIKHDCQLNLDSWIEPFDLTIKIVMSTSPLNLPFFIIWFDLMTLMVSQLLLPFFLTCHFINLNVCDNVIEWRLTWSVSITWTCLEECIFLNLTLGEIIQADSQSYQSSSLTRGTAGKQRGQDDHRSGVLKHVLKYIETKAPTTFVLENVPGLRGRKHRLPDLPFISFTLVIWSFHWLIDLKYWIYCGLNSLDLTWTPTLKTLVASLRKALQGLDEPAPQHEGGEWQATLPCCVEGHGMHWMTIISQRFWWVNLSKSIQIIKSIRHFDKSTQNSPH